MIRRANANDSIGMGKVYCYSWQEAYKNIVPADFLLSLTPENCAPQGSKISPENCFLFEEDSEILGLVNFGVSRDQSEPWGEIRTIYVLPSHWRHGIGRQLFLAASDALEVSGYEGFYLWVLTDNSRARHFYESMGMVTEGENRTITIAGAELSETKYKFSF